MTTKTRNGGKADGLFDLLSIGKTDVPPFTTIPADTTDTQEINGIISTFLRKNPEARSLAIRSSALKEDSATGSLAGAFDTLLNVPATPQDIFNAIGSIRHTGHHKMATLLGFDTQDSHDSMGIVIQQMVSNPDVAGVCLSQGHTEQDRAYRLVNFRKGLGEELVSGMDNGTELRILRNIPLRPETIARYPFLPDLMDKMDRIEAYYQGRPTDTEFAAKGQTAHMLQARPLVTRTPSTSRLQQQTAAHIGKIAEEIAAIPENDLLCDMADINPRELLGHPAKPENITLFRTMFADTLIETTRAAMGYAPLHTGLLHTIGDKPYVSLRASAYSLRPQGISDTTYDKMVACYKNTLQHDPSLQDSVEFNVYMISAEQLPAFFGQNRETFSPIEQREITKAFETLDANMNTQVNAFCTPENREIQTYRARAVALQNNQSPSFEEAIATLQEGTALFVRTARLAFYQKNRCNKRYTEETTNRYLIQLDTPSEQLQRDIRAHTRGQKSTTELCAEYGHIRPGQMDIHAQTYATDIERNLDLPHARSRADHHQQEEQRENEQRMAIDFDLAKLPPAQNQDIRHLRTLIAAREKVKHEFMRAYGVVATIIKSTPETTSETYTPAILLPEILSNTSDLACIETTHKTGSYFGTDRIEAPPLIVNDDNLKSLNRSDVEGKILVMDHADPGYDFLLLYEPAGILTRIGGPASHIAIRVNEHNIPAAIGCGIDPATVDTSRQMVLDCPSRKHYAGNRIVPQPEPTHPHPQTTPAHRTTPTKALLPC